MEQATHAATYVGKRVRWLGKPQTGFVTAAYQRALTAGERRLPTPDEQCSLATGEEGTVIELLYATRIGHVYAIRFVGGYELETVLPADVLVRFVDDPGDSPGDSGVDQDDPVLAPAAPPAKRRRYAEHRATPPLLHRLRALVRRLRHGGQPRHKRVSGDTRL